MLMYPGRNGAPPVGGGSKLRGKRANTRGSSDSCAARLLFSNFSTFTKIPQVPSFQAHSPVKTVFPKNAKNARKSQNTPSTNPYQNETQFSPLSLKSRTSGHPRPTKSVICPPVISGTNSRASSLKLAKFRHGTAGLSNVGVSPIGGRGKPFRLSFPKRTRPESRAVCNHRQPRRFHRFRGHVF